VQSLPMGPVVPGKQITTFDKIVVNRRGFQIDLFIQVFLLVSVLKIPSNPPEYSALFG
jgi:hypothetical protein